jgi:hypothetical protein
VPVGEAKRAMTALGQVKDYLAEVKADRDEAVARQQQMLELLVKLETLRSLS